MTTTEKNEKGELNRYFKIGATIFITLACVIMFFFVLLRFDGFTDLSAKLIGTAQPIIIGLVIAYVLNPIMKFWERQIHKVTIKRVKNEAKIKKIDRGLAVTASIIFFLLVIGLLLAAIVPATIESITNLIQKLPSETRDFSNWVTDIVRSNKQLSDIAQNTVNRITTEMEKWVQGDLIYQSQKYITGITSGILSVFQVLLNCFIGIIVAIYVMTIQEQLTGQSKKLIYAIFKPKKANIIIEVVRHSNSIFGGFITGKIIDSAIMGVICYIGCLCLSIPNAMLVAVIVGVTNIIPFFGPFIGAAPSLLITVIESPIHALYLLAFEIVLQQVDGNIIGPKILGNSTGLSSFWVMFAILISGGMFGFIGMLLGVPVFAVIYYIVTQLVNYMLKHRKLPTNTERYIEMSSIDEQSNELLYEKNENQKASNTLSSKEKFLKKELKNFQKNKDNKDESNSNKK
ncbi:Predicted PurR-regulated permease PerM [Lachnospiraceae bacterium C7]|nr:Predicted PurR-regulated permease PerM [Lachnospiraceae bacterium C7]